VPDFGNISPVDADSAETFDDRVWGMHPLLRWGTFPVVGLLPAAIGVLLVINPGGSRRVFPPYGFAIWFGISLAWLYFFYRVFFRPRLVAGPSGLRIRNPFRKMDLTWSEVADVRPSDPHLLIDTTEGQSIRVIALARPVSESGNYFGRDRRYEVVQVFRAMCPSKAPVTKTDSALEKVANKIRLERITLENAKVGRLVGDRERVIQASEERLRKLELLYDRLVSELPIGGA
jgi:hypothetical protein